MAQFKLSGEEKQLYDQSMQYFSTRRLMTWEQIADVRRMGMDVQSHTARHPFLTQISPERLTDELSRSRQTLMQRLGIDSNLICYPYGNCDDNVVAAAREAGYRVGFLSGRLNLTPDPLRIGRVPVSGAMGCREVSFRLSRAYEALWKLKNRRN
jgi:peptidoglycan/xylan/chitin deacetylase (PgdA/CDA1 family)